VKKLRSVPRIEGDAEGINYNYVATVLLVVVSLSTGIDFVLQNIK